MNQPGTKFELLKGVDADRSFSKSQETSETASPAIATDSSTISDLPPSGKTSENTDINLVYALVSDELGKVEHLLREELNSDTPWISKLLEHNWIRGGKRIRPLMLLLSGGSCGSIHDGHVFCAAAIEMIHAATLVHDDVIDKANVRRHLPTVNARWGDRMSILLGDFLFTHAFQLASRSEHCAAVAEIASCSSRVCSGEIRQNDWQGRFELSELDYLEMIADKTGALCECSCRVGALLTGRSRQEVDRFGEYGRSLGIAFQIIDDVLDLVGSESKVGKTLGTDVINQKLTLPMIHSLENGLESDREELQNLLKSQTPDVARILELLHRSGSIDYARNMARRHISSAIEFSGLLPQTQYSEALRRMAEFVIMRLH